MTTSVKFLEASGSIVGNALMDASSNWRVAAAVARTMATVKRRTRRCILFPEIFRFDLIDKN
jgi:hypothetical protein